MQLYLRIFEFNLMNYLMNEDIVQKLEDIDLMQEDIDLVNHIDHILVGL